MKNTPDNIRKILLAAKGRFVSVYFTKADGTQRQLTTNPQQIGEILGTGTPCKDPAVFRIVDVKLNQWRYFRAERVSLIKSDGNVIEFSAED